MGYVIDKLFGCPETLEDIRTVYLLLFRQHLNTLLFRCV